MLVTNEQMRYIFDADGLIALYDPEHPNHNNASTILQKLDDANAEAILPYTAVCEAVTIFQRGWIDDRPGARRKPKPHLANFLVKKLRNSPLTYYGIPSTEIVLQALKIYENEGFVNTWGNTLFDAIIATIAIQSQTKVVFSFDGVYSRIRKYLKVKLWLAEEVFPTTQPPASKPN